MGSDVTPVGTGEALDCAGEEADVGDEEPDAQADTRKATTTPARHRGEIRTEADISAG